MGCPCEGGPLNHSTYDDLGNGHIQWVDILVITESVQMAKCMFHWAFMEVKVPF